MESVSGFAYVLGVPIPFFYSVGGEWGARGKRRIHHAV